jgi:hypothetical protein
MDPDDVVTKLELLEAYRAVAERLARRICAGEYGLRTQLALYVERMAEISQQLQSSVEDDWEP